MNPIIIGLLLLANAVTITVVVRSKPITNASVLALVLAGIAIGLLTSLAIRQIVG